MEPNACEEILSRWRVGLESVSFLWARAITVISLGLPIWGRHLKWSCDLPRYWWQATNGPLCRAIRNGKGNDCHYLLEITRLRCMHAPCCFIYQLLPYRYCLNKVKWHAQTVGFRDLDLKWWLRISLACMVIRILPVFIIFWKSWQILERYGQYWSNPDWILFSRCPDFGQNSLCW